MPDVTVPPAGPGPRPPFRVLVVCTGNVHRSPLTERLLAARLAHLPGMFRVSSAGTAAAPGMPIDPVAAALLAERGVAAQGAVARRLTAALVDGADLVLGAAREHRDAAVRLSPAWALRRAFTVREFARLLRDEDAAGASGPVDRAASLVRGAAARRGIEGHRADDDEVADPYGAPEPVARACAARIAESVERIACAVLGRSLTADR